MKLVKKITVNDDDFYIVSDFLILEANNPGRGIITVQSTKKLSGILKYYIGYGKEYKLYMTAIIDSCIQVDKEQQRIEFRELSHILSHIAPISMRHVNAETVLKKLSDLSGLEFILQENQSWKAIEIPHVYNFGSGIDVLEFLGEELEIQNFVWQSQPDGSIYIGSWEGSPMGKATLVKLPANTISNVTNLGGRIGIIESMRPGAHIKFGNSEPTYISTVEIQAETMKLGWDQLPWAHRGILL